MIRTTIYYFLLVEEALFGTYFALPFINNEERSECFEHSLQFRQQMPSLLKTSLSSSEDSSRTLLPTTSMALITNVLLTMTQTKPILHNLLEYFHNDFLQREH